MTTYRINGSIPSNIANITVTGGSLFWQRSNSNHYHHIMRSSTCALLLCPAACSFTLPTLTTTPHHHISTTVLGYISDSDLPSSAAAPLPSKELQQQRPVRRSFLHQLDRFLTELQGKPWLESSLLSHTIHLYNSLTILALFPGTHDHLRKHTFLSGNFAPVSKENSAVPVEVVEGSIPENLDGAFLRNGPNPIRGIQKKRYHWFDGRECPPCLRITNNRSQLICISCLCGILIFTFTSQMQCW